jgi:hypothetical protein
MPRNQNTIKTDTARKQLESLRFKDFPRLKQARILYKQYPLIYKDVEDARAILRYVAGKKGVRARKDLGKELAHIETVDRPKNPYNLPQSDEMEYKPFIIKEHKRIGVLNDIHVPYHSMAALTAAIDFLKKDNVDAVILNGDFWDFFQLSRFLKDPMKRHFGDELSMGPVY